jgi:death on curing protein
LFFEVNKSHCFQDGNKRIAITLGSMFLLKNGYLSVVKEFLFKMETISYHVAAGRISKPLLNEIITSIIHEEDYSEELKLKLLNSIRQ